MSADTIQSLAQESMVPEDFKAFLTRNRLTQTAAAALLGRSRRQIANYTSIGPIPRIVALACHGFEALRRNAGIVIPAPTTELDNSKALTAPGPDRGGQRQRTL